MALMCAKAAFNVHLKTPLYWISCKQVEASEQEEKPGDKLVWKSEGAY